MKLKDRIKTYNFWVSLSSAVFLILKVIGNQFNFKVNESLFSDIVTSLCSILVILGIIVPPTNKLDIKNNVNDIKDESVNKSKNADEEKVTSDEDFKQDTESKTYSINQELENADCDVDLNDTNNSENFTTNLADYIENKIEESNLDNIIINNESDLNIKQKVTETLSNQTDLFDGDINTYIELLQNQIDLLQEK